MSDSDSEADVTSKKPHRYGCPLCEQTFSFPNNRNRHVARIHAESFGARRERYECHICLNNYSTRGYLKQHLLQVHKKQTQISCKICTKTFACRNGWRDHMRYIHDAGRLPRNLFTCDHCERKFNKKSNMRVHIMYSKCNPHRLIRKRVPCPYCEVKLLESGLRTHLLYCPVKFQAIQGAGKRRVKLKRFANRHKEGKRKAEVNITKNDKVERNIDVTSLYESEAPTIKLEPIEVPPDCGTSTYLNESENYFVRRSGRKRKHIDYRQLNGSVDDFVDKPFKTEDTNEDVLNNYWNIFASRDYNVGTEYPTLESRTPFRSDQNVDRVGATGQEWLEFEIEN